MRVSGASIYDYVTLNAQMRALYSDRYNCDEEVKKIESRMSRFPGRDAKDIIEKYRKSRGCGRVVNRTIDRIGNIKFNTCLCRIKHPLFDQLQTITDFYDKGGLPFDGSLMDQPAQVIELIEIMNSAKNREINELRKANNG